MPERLVEGPIAYVTAAILGALLGSFANVCILRIPAGKSIAYPGSHCFACGAPVRWYDNLPILSFLILGGRCRACRAKFSPRYLFVEAATAMIVLAVYHLCVSGAGPHAGDDVARRLARFGVYTLFVLALVVIAFIDLDHKKIPDKITYPAIPLFLLLGVLLHDRPWWELLVGAAGGYLLVRLISDGYYHLTGREGLGYGDGKLLAMVGALLGWRAVLFALFGGSLLGTVLVLPPLLVTSARRRRQRGHGWEDFVARVEKRERLLYPSPDLRHVEIPFGPFLIAASLAWLFLQDMLALAVSRFLWW
jgi:leader peptidase (prepilin peptidase)/N-methyltransferase